MRPFQVIAGKSGRIGVWRWSGNHDYDALVAVFDNWQEFIEFGLQSPFKVDIVFWKGYEF